MPVTLAQAQVNTQDDVDYAVIDNLRRYSWVLDQMVFDDVVTPGSTGDPTLTYAYTRLTTPRAAAFRAFNTEYTAAAATRTRYTVDLKGFDGLDKILTNADTEWDPNDHGVTAGYVDWTIATVNTQAEALTALDQVDDWLSRIVPSRVGSGNLNVAGALPIGVKAILGNTSSINRLRALARWAGLYTTTQDELGRQIEMYGPWVLQDMGDGVTGSAPIIPIETRDADGGGGGGNITNLTDLYAVCFGLDAFHGASMAGSPLVETYMPDWSQPGAVKSGEVEMGPVAAVLRNTKACGVLRNIKVA